ncbi:MAG: hypothetical protein RI519_01090 [Balneolaceae bacterium]|nr:hypothetical protein [Balneolaceae bacterium]
MIELIVLQSNSAWLLVGAFCWLSPLYAQSVHAQSVDEQSVHTQAVHSQAVDARSVLLTDSTLNWIPAFSLQEATVHAPTTGVAYGTMLRNAPMAMEQPNGEIQTSFLRTDGALWRNPWTGRVPLHLIPASDVGKLTTYGQRRSFTSVRRQSPKPVIELDFFERGQEDRSLNLLYGQNVTQSIHLEVAYSTINEQGDYDGFQGEYSTLRSAFRWEMDSTESLHLRYSTYSSKQTEAQAIQGYTPNGFSYNPLVESPVYPFVRVEPSTRRLSLKWAKNPSPSLSTNIGLQRDSHHGEISGISTLAGGQSLDWMSTRTQVNAHITKRGSQGSLTGSIWLEHTSNTSNSMTVVEDPSWFTGLEAAGVRRWTTRIQTRVRAEWMRPSTSSFGIGELRMDHSWQSEGLEVTLGIGQRANAPSLLMKQGSLPAVINAPEWSHQQMTPNESLKPKTITFIELTPNWSAGSFHLEGTLAWLHTKDEWLRTPQGSWRNGPEYRSLQGSAMASVKARDVTFRLGGYAMDAFVQQEGTLDPNCMDCTSKPSSRDLRLYGWGQVELERAFFDQATYVNMGLTLRASPVQQAGWIWSPWLQRWIRAGHELELPSTATVDAYLSARLRWMMIFMRMDQASDQLWQAGSMDSYGVPKSGRRFIFGIRVLFKN